MKLYLIIILLVTIISIIIISLIQIYKNKNKSKSSDTNDNTNDNTILIPNFYNIAKNKNTKVELVLAICYEDVNWIENQANNYDLITIYNKCDKNIKFSQDNIKIITLENIGSCDYAFLNYIIDRYETLPDFIEFGKGSSEPNKLYKLCSACYNDEKYVKKIEKILKLKIPNHQFANNKPNNNLKWFDSGFNSLEDWLKDFGKLSKNLFQQNTCNIIFGGHFIVTKQQILRNSLDVYKKLISYQKNAREEVDHYIERIWRPLLCRPKFFLVVVGIFKNEKNSMKEWLDHHMKQGVEHFYLIDNGSTDDWIVETLNAPITVITDSKKYSQNEHYNKFLETVKINSEWVMVIDLDEFVYTRIGETIPSVLKKYNENVGVIEMRWKMFGSNNHIKQPNGIINNFTKRKKMEIVDKNGSFDNVKSIIKTSVLKKLDIHKSDTYNCEIITEPSTNDENLLSKSPLQLNHYAIQSKDWFVKVKMTREDAVHPQNVRNLDYFKKYDRNDIHDDELSQIYTSNKEKNEMNIPYIINNYNDIENLKVILNKLNLKGYKNIIVLNNNSNYISLLDYYNNYDFLNIARVINLKNYYGENALIESGLSKGLDNNWYIYKSNIKTNEDSNDDYTFDGSLINKDNSLVTSIITTCCRKNTPDTSIIKQTIESLKIVPELSKQVIIVFDGGPIINEKDINEKCKTECNNDLYNEYKNNVQKISVDILGIDNVMFVYLKNRSCLSHCLHTGMNLIKTKFVNIVQEDLPIIRKFDFNYVIKIMNKYKDVNIIRYSIGKNIFHNEWGKKHCFKVENEEIRVLDENDSIKISKALHYSDNNQISTKEFYDKYIWPNVNKYSFMENDLLCISNNVLKDKIWFIGDYEDGDYSGNNDGRNV